MSQRPLQPPSGAAPPTSVVVDGAGTIQLLPLAQEICRRYRNQLPHEYRRYGEAVGAWCIHDNHYLLYWAAETVNGYINIEDEVAWLASFLEAREFPLERLARNLDIAAEVVLNGVHGVTSTTHRTRLSRVLRRAARFVRSRESFLDGQRPRQEGSASTLMSRPQTQGSAATGTQAQQEDAALRAGASALGRGTPRGPVV